jgi:RNA polymerase sigma-70 factor (ECF subfamily)
MQILSSEDSHPGTTTGLEQLFQDHKSLIVGTAYRVTGTRADAEDVLQTVFMRLFKRWDQLELSASPGAYLRRAAVNASLDLLRARSRSKSISIDEMTGEIEDRRSVSAERHRHDAEMRRQLRQAVAKLTENSARIFTLRYLEEYDNKEIASMLGMTQTAVAVVLHRARHKVRQEISEFLGGIES